MINESARRTLHNVSDVPADAAGSSAGAGT